jgi:raffinose/stachyose/melibiose transport system permease protein
MNKVMSNKWIITLYILPSLFLLLVMVYIPTIFTGYYGLTSWDGVGALNFIGLTNYKQLIHDSTFWSSAGHSFLFALLSTAALAVYLLVAVVLTSGIRGASLLCKIYLFPMLLSSVAVAQLWLKVYHPTQGILNAFLASLGVHNPPAWLADPKTVLGAIFLPILWQYAGFYILIYYSALKNIPASLVEAARIDGANPLQIAFRIKIPLIAEVVKVTIVLAVVGSLKYFDLIYVMTGGGPNHASDVMASYMYNKAFSSFDYGYGSAIGFFLLVITLAATWIIRKLTASDDKIQYS